MSRDWGNPPEIQTVLDECADGTWQGQIYLGSNLHIPAGQDHSYVNGATYREAALRMAEIIEALLNV